MGESMCGLGTPLMASEGAPCRPRPSPVRGSGSVCVPPGLLDKWVRAGERGLPLVQCDAEKESPRCGG